MRLYLFLVFCLLSELSNAQVVINEVLHKPGPNTSTNQGLRRKEYAEIYNNSCSSVDISCWVIGSGVPGFGGNDYIGAFQFPQGTIIQPGQHLVIGGTDSQNGTNYSASDIDFDVATYLGSSTCDPNTNWLLPNGDGWLALYNNQGIPVDAVYWSWGSSQPNINTDSDYDMEPCIPSACSGISSLPSAKDINTSYPAVIQYLGEATSYDMTFSRVPDGGNWTRNISPSIAGANQCNDGQCASQSTLYVSASVTPPSCGTNNGEITLTPSPPNTSYTYTWSNDGSNNTNSDNNLSAGTYNITIDNNGCTWDTTITLDSPVSFTVNSSISDPGCSGNDGEIILNPTPAGTNYTYNWSNDVTNSSNTDNNLPAGNYNITINDGLCSWDTSITLNTSTSFAVQATITEPGCSASNGEIILNPTPAGSNYTYNWSNDNTNSTNFDDNLAAGNYNITISDGSCIWDTTINLNNSSAPNITTTSVNPTCASNDGTASASVTGGSTPYTYLWNDNNSQTSSSATGLGTGTFSVTVTDNNGCQGFASVSLSNNVQLLITLTETNILCNGENTGEIQSIVSGGDTPYSYQWSTLQTTSLSTGLTSGVYTLTVQDVNGCKSTAEATLTEPSAITLSLQSSSVSCQGSNDGSAQVVAQGGVSSYTYLWSNGATTNNSIGLQVGNYSVTVQDANSCAKNDDVIITKVNGFTVDFDTIPISCADATDGAFLTTVTGGNNVSYLWSTGETSSNIYNISSGTYHVTITDDNNCEQTQTLDLENSSDICSIHFVPNIFSPNSDGENDVLYFYGKGVKEFELSIFDRWGEQVFETTDLSSGWDGNYRGREMNSDVFVYILQLVFNQNPNETIIEKGNITLIR